MNFINFITKIIFIFAIVWLSATDNVVQSQNVLESNIIFQFYKENSTYFTTSNSTEDNLIDISGCNSTNKLAIIVHGWTDSCSDQWAVNMIQNLFRFRGGCVVCMNWEKYGNNIDYYDVVRKFTPISRILTNKLRQFERELFAPQNFYMFGFSYGAQLVLNAARDFGKQVIPHIDACEPAGPGFDANVTYSKLYPMDAAKFVQCIHTSANYGTTHYNCTQNWLMGNCGLSQAAAGPPPLGSHGLCPYIFDSAFTNSFPAIPKPNSSGCRKTTRSTSKITDISMGYLSGERLIQSNNSFAVGGETLYANTYASAPHYNVPIKKSAPLITTNSSNNDILINSL